MIRHFGPDGGPGVHVVGLLVHLAFNALILAVIVLGVFLLVRALGGRPHAFVAPGFRSPAIAELELRYARGEMSRDEFLQRRADLLGTPAPAPAPTPTPPPTSSS
jgi:uncharacterized membrane protein